jgi:hypothetical protein
MTDLDKLSALAEAASLTPGNALEPGGLRQRGRIWLRAIPSEDDVLVEAEDAARCRPRGPGRGAGMNCPIHPEYRGVPVQHVHAEHDPYGHTHEMPCCERHSFAIRKHHHGDEAHSHPHHEVLE